MHLRRINHIAIIPDGNRRWAESRGLEPHTGHLEGAKRVRELIEKSDKIPANFITIWGSSYDNLTKRSRVEVAVFEKIYESLAKEILSGKLDIRDSRIQFIGEWENLLSKKTVGALCQVEEKTQSNKGKLLTALIGYNGNREMLAAIDSLTKTHKSVSERDVANSLWTSNLPQIDLVIRTGNDPHLSNGFMMWLTQNAYLHFSKKMWPEFHAKHLLHVVAKAEQYERRSGA